MPKGLKGFQKGNQAARITPEGRVERRKKKFELKRILDANLPKIWEELAKMRGKDYFNAIAIIAPYVLPKLSQSDIQVNHQQVDDKYKGLSVDALRKIHDIMLEDQDNTDIKLLDDGVRKD